MTQTTLLTVPGGGCLACEKNNGSGFASKLSKECPCKDSQSEIEALDPVVLGTERVLIKLDEEVTIGFPIGG